MGPIEFGMVNPVANLDEEMGSAGSPPPPAQGEMVPLLPTTLLDSNDLDDVSRRPPTEYSTDNDDTFSVMPWWPVQGGLVTGVSDSGFHMNTRLPDGRVSVIVDTGAWGNLSG